MDAATEQHLRTWISEQHARLDDHEQDVLLDRMRDTYDSDPELFDRLGWWRVYDHADVPEVN